MQGVVGQKPWVKDPLVVRKRWSGDEYNLIDHGEGNPLCFAIMWDDGLVVPHPPIIRGLELTKKALLAAGHKGGWYTFPCHLLRSFVVPVTDWKPPKHGEIYDSIVSSHVPSCCKS